MAGLDLILDTDGDVLWRDGDLVLGIKISQVINVRLRTWLEEWFLDQSIGTPWLQTIFRKPVNLDHIEQILRRRIRETEGVTAITRFTLSLEGRRLSVEYRVETNAGQVADGVEVFS